MPFTPWNNKQWRITPVFRHSLPGTTNNERRIASRNVSDGKTASFYRLINNLLPQQELNENSKSNRKTTTTAAGETHPEHQSIETTSRFMGDMFAVATKNIKKGKEMFADYRMTDEDDNSAQDNSKDESSYDDDNDNDNNK